MKNNETYISYGVDEFLKFLVELNDLVFMEYIIISKLN
jgi:hypothetical protein